MSNYQDDMRNNERMVEELRDNQVSKEERYWEKRKKLLSKFVDSQKQYSNNPLFRSVFEALARDVEPLKVIQHLIDYCAEKDKLIQECLTLHGYPKTKQPD